MLEALLLILVIASASQKTEDRRYSALLFSWLSIAHYVIMYNADGWEYYFSAGLCDAAVVFFTIRLRVISPVIESLHAICYISILMNFFGWLLWQLYLPPDAYNAAFLLIYGWAILNLLRMESDDAGRYHAMGVGHRHILNATSQSDNSHTKETYQK